MFNLLREISNLLPTHVCKLERQKILETLNMINVNITPPSAGTSNNVSKLSRTKMQHAEMHQTVQIDLLKCPLSEGIFGFKVFGFLYLFPVLFLQFLFSFTSSYVIVCTIFSLRILPDTNDLYVSNRGCHIVLVLMINVTLKEYTISIVLIIHI